MKNNITIIGLVGNFKKNVAKALADKLEIIFADVNDIMEFNLIDNHMIEFAGQDYFDKNETKTVKLLASYENTVITLNFSTLNKGNNLNILKKTCVIIYLRLNYEQFQILNKLENYGALSSINEKVFNDRDKLMNKMCDIAVEVDNLDVQNVVNHILMGLKNYFSKNE